MPWSAVGCGQVADDSGERLAFLAVTDLIGFLRGRTPNPAAPQASTVGTRALGLIDQHPVQAGARPPAARPRNTTWNCGLSPRWLAVMTTDRGFWCCSQARCTLVVSPPPDRPGL
jgi:hypothetical protein